LALENAYEGGNKILAITGSLQAYGRPRTAVMSRLTQEALKDDQSFFVEAGLDWEEGDRLALLPTSYRYDASDEVIITSYDAGTGQVQADRPLSFYHFGRDTSTADLYNGLDIRGEVLLLTRNVKIQGDYSVIPQVVVDEELQWGGQIVVGWMLEQDFSTRYGNLTLDHVELNNMSQADTSKAAIRWEKNPNGYSTVSNCAIHNGYGWVINIEES
jgi:hypothetical protein